MKKQLQQKLFIQKSIIASLNTFGRYKSAPDTASATSSMGCELIML
jgi:hypothetical protein